MTLVIVLSIVASIMVIFGLSVLYAKTSKKCRGRRRKLDDDDPEAVNKRTQDTSTYYDQVKKLQRKRRLHAKRQSRSMDSERKRKGGADRESRKRKMSDANKTKRERKRSSSRVPDKTRSTQQSKTTRKRGAKKSTKDRKDRKQRSVQEKPPKVANDSRKEQKRKTDFENRPKPATSRSHNVLPRKNAMLQNLRTMLFCIPFRERRRERFKHQTRNISTQNRAVEKTRKPSIVAVNSVSSSSSSNASSTNKSVPARPKRQPVAKTSSTLQKPPRPPPPTFSTLTLRVNNSPANDFENNNNHRAAVSSGYSSEGGKIKRVTARHSHSEAEEHNEEVQTVPSAPSSKRVEMMSYDLNAGEKEESNPYDHYPVAQSYRQYLDFGNDYRRTTGDYRPQYDNIKVIPLQTAKKKDKPDKTMNANDKNPELKKSIQGGMKYIDIASKESDDNDVPTKKHSKKNHKERYENPSARDKRTNLEDCNKKKVTKRSKDKKKKERKSKKLDATTRAILAEKIIVNGNMAANATPLPKVQQVAAPVIIQK